MTVEYEREILAKRAVELGVDLSLRDNEANETALMIATRCGFDKIAQILGDAGAEEWIPYLTSFMRSLFQVIPTKVYITFLNIFCYLRDDLRVTAYLCDSHSLNSRVSVSPEIHNSCKY
jgi:hypothetical protein